MAVPSSGELKLWDTLWNQELGGSQGENSLHSASIYAGFDTPDALSDFYGWSDVEVPAVSTSAASSVSYASMTANGNVTSTGNENPDRGFYFGTSYSYASNTKYSIGTGGTGAFSRSMTGLSQLSTYRYFAYASNSAGEVVGGRVDQATTEQSYSVGLVISRGWGSNQCGNSNAAYWINPYSGRHNHIGNNGRSTCTLGPLPSNAPGRVIAHNPAPAHQSSAQVSAHRCQFYRFTARSCGFSGPYGFNYGSVNNCGITYSWNVNYQTSGWTANAYFRYQQSDIRLKTNITYL